MIYRYEILGKIVRVKAESQASADAYVKLVYGWPEEPEIETEIETDVDQADGESEAGE